MNNEKPLGYKNYGSIPHLQDSKLNQQADKKIHINQEKLLTKKPRDWKDLVIVTEKLDGSNVGICKKDGFIYPIGRSGYIAITSPHKQHKKFYEWVMQNYERFKALLKEGERICGEWLYQVHTLRYDLKHEPFVAFDFFLDKETRMCYIPFIKKMAKFNITTAHLVHIGQPITTKRAMKLLGQGGHGCLEVPEGLVYRIERDNKVDFLSKYVRPGKEDGKYMKEEIVQKGVIL